ncbi:smek1, partial [Symbiodinium sp. KB8]
PADPSPDTDQDAPGGGDSAAAAVVSAVPASNAENGWRVKVYRLHDQDGTWESLGIGRIRDKAHSTLAPGEEWAIDVEEEDSTGAPSGERWLLHCPVQAPEDYKRQDGTIITWNEQPTNVDLALSFQEDVGCGRVWQDIQDVGRAARADGRLQMGFVHSDGSGMFGSVQRALDGSSDSAMDLLSDTAESLYPNQAFRRRGVGMLGASRHLGSESDDDCERRPCPLAAFPRSQSATGARALCQAGTRLECREHTGTLLGVREPDIERLRRAVMAVTPATLTSVCNRIISEAGLSHDPVCTALARKGFGALDAFLAAVLGAEEEGNLEALHSAHSALSQIMSVADRDIVERCCAPHRFLALAAVCEYDPALPVRPRHRLHLLTRATLVQAMSPDVPELSRRAHLLFRISFFQNVLAPHMAEDTLPATLNQLADACRAEIVSAVTDMPHLTSAM